MSITTTVTAHCTADDELDTCVFDAMIEAQDQLGQITWHTITDHHAAGTYRSTEGAELPITITITTTD